MYLVTSIPIAKICHEMVTFPKDLCFRNVMDADGIMFPNSGVFFREEESETEPSLHGDRSKCQLNWHVF